MVKAQDLRWQNWWLGGFWLVGTKVCLDVCGVEEVTQFASVLYIMLLC